MVKNGLLNRLQEQLLRAARSHPLSARASWPRPWPKPSARARGAIGAAAHGRAHAESHTTAVRHERDIAMVRVNLLLLAMLVICALSLVTSRHQARKLYVELERERARAHSYETEFGQLQLEQSTW